MPDDHQTDGQPGTGGLEPGSGNSTGRSWGGLLAATAVLTLVAALYLGGLLGFVESQLLDSRFRLVSRPASGDLVVVSIDPRSLQMLDVWPWPRGYHATVLDNLLTAGARRVAFDIDFSSRSIPDEDRELEKALESAGHRAILPVFVQHDPSGTTETRPLPAFRRHVTLASINIRPEADGLSREYRLAQSVGGRALPTVAAALTDGSLPQHNAFFVDFSIAPATIPQLSYVDVLTGRFDPAEVRNKVALIGATAVELGDQVAVPVYAAVPGVLLQGLAFESIHQGRALTRLGHRVALGLVLRWQYCSDRPSSAARGEPASPSSWRLRAACGWQPGSCTGAAGSFWTSFPPSLA